MSGKDLGTYWFRIELVDGRGWLYRWDTGAHYSDGTHNQTHLKASRFPPGWESEEDLFDTVVWMHTEGNYSCDCNKRLFLTRAHQQETPEDNPCGGTMPIERITAIRPDGEETEIHPETEKSKPKEG